MKTPMMVMSTMTMNSTCLPASSERCLMRCPLVCFDILGLVINLVRRMRVLNLILIVLCSICFKRFVGLQVY